MTSIVDTPTLVATPDGDDSDPLEAIHRRLLAEQARFLGSVGNGPQVYSAFGLAQVVHEIVAERVTGAVREFASELTTASDQVRHLVDLLVASDERADRYAAENTALRDELHGREPVT
jgi:hypothetical protein